MLRECYVFLAAICAASGYYTLPGNCPENVQLQEDFRLANVPCEAFLKLHSYIELDGKHGHYLLPLHTGCQWRYGANQVFLGLFGENKFYNTWYQVYHYSSDGRQLNNCSSIQLVTTSTGVHANLSRVDRGLFGRYSVAEINIPEDIEDSARLGITFRDVNAPRRLVTRKYPFWVLATSDHFATVYTCQYSPLIDKHYIYVWVLSRSKVFNDVSLQLATDSIKRLGIKPEALTKDDWSAEKCTVKYFEETSVAPVTFRHPVPI